MFLLGSRSLGCSHDPGEFMLVTFQHQLMELCYSECHHVYATTSREGFKVFIGVVRHSRGILPVLLPYLCVFTEVPAIANISSLQNKKQSRLPRQLSQYFRFISAILFAIYCPSGWAEGPNPRPRTLNSLPREAVNPIIKPQTLTSSVFVYPQGSG